MSPSGSKGCCWSSEISNLANTTALKQLCLSFKVMTTKRSTYSKMYFPESYSTNSAVITCLLAQVLEQRPMNSQLLSPCWRQLNTAQHSLTENLLQLGWCRQKGISTMLTKSLSKKTWFLKSLRQPSSNTLFILHCLSWKIVFDVFDYLKQCHLVNLPKTT